MLKSKQQLKGATGHTFRITPLQKINALLLDVSQVLQYAFFKNETRKRTSFMSVISVSVYLTKPNFKAAKKLFMSTKTEVPKFRNFS